MKITQIMLAKGFGGAERYFVDLSRELAGRGHQVQAIFHPDFQGRSWLEETPGLQPDPVTVHGVWDMFAVRKITSLIKAFNPDVMHGHLARAACLAGKARRGLEIPFTVKTHNYVNLKYYQDVDWFLPTTKDQRDYLISHGIKAEKISVLPNFSSVNSVDRVQKKRSEPHKLTYGSIGRLVKKKGYEQLIRAFNQALKQGLEANLVIGGDGEEKPRLESLIQELNLQQQVQLCGWVNDVETFYENINVFVLPSLDEPFGIVMLEAMAHGVPIISTRTQGPKEILDAENAYLIDIDDEPQLVQALLDISDDEERRLQRASNALEKFRQTYSSEAVVPQIVLLYEKMKSGSIQ